MCGIAGTIGSTASLAGVAACEMIGRMCDVIEHRGPDDWGFRVENFGDSHLAIGMRRLSIIDVASGHQPICNEDGSVWIVFNGEIYNYRELREDLIARGHRFVTRTDTETIVHLYEEEGERCVERLRGMFGFAIWDSRSKSLLLARDRVGKKPVHYAQSNGAFVFGSEIKSLLRHPAIKREVNLEAISDFLTFGYVPDPQTAFKGIYKLPPGHTLSFKDGQIRTRRYWNFSYDGESSSEPRLTENEYVGRLRQLLAESVRVRLESEVPLGAFLSGGIDSSTVVALMARQMNQPVKTFSIGFGEADFDELKHARVTARLLETDHHEFVVTPDVCRLAEEVIWHHDEPFADVSSLPTYIVSKMAREHVTVVLSGDGGDEVFGGYQRYLIEREREKFELIPSFIRHQVFLRLSRALPRGAYGKRYLSINSRDAGPRYVDALSYFDEETKRSLFSKSLLAELNGYTSAKPFEEIFEEPVSRARLDRLMYLDSKTYLPGDILVKVDRMSMAHSIETRAPLLDHRLIEFAQIIPASLKLRRTTRGWETKYILKQAVEGLIPNEIIHRPKQGFDVPIKHWLKRELGEMCHDLLTSSSARQRGYLNVKTVAGLLQEHRLGVRDNARHLWALLALELWHRSFIDHEPAASFTGVFTDTGGAAGLGRRKAIAKAFGGG
ncbi:MAG: asparagine synthase (glutamine-hydrolyzing) [Blastocatellales bacterium]